MGLTFPSFAMRMGKRVAVAPMTALLRHLSCMVLATLARWGLLRLPKWEGGGDAGPVEESGNYVLVMDGATPSLVHVHVLTPLIKKRVPVVEFGEFLERQHHPAAGGGVKEEEARCAVCLSGVEKRDEIRELRNCGHVFHRRCLDCWVDMGHVTCPLCRSLLLPTSSDMATVNTTTASSDISGPSRRRNEPETDTD